ncbi:hypothetical protein NXS98_00500 [Fontisphaera persica]|uniref:hypothetical protein n=1 Tax=Fontisphaera persica TaxID=2974023 RepID=UPI0024BFF234|nr:hypothetical protein [Fontisphaera persica]WCJ59631.1 hypothetical protein NXS98_00500 [Fontisphaera persica]
MAFICRIALAFCLLGWVVGSVRGQAAAAIPGTLQGDQDLLEFLSGDVLRGRLLGMDTNGLRWQHASHEPVLTIKPQGVYKVRLARTQPLPVHRSDAMVRLVNGDEIRGELREMDERMVVLRTWYAGDLRLQRQGLASLQTGLSRYQVLYEGPDGLEGWTNQSGVRTDFINGGWAAAFTSPQARFMVNGWHYYNGAFYGINAGFLGRQLDLPPVSCIEFDLAWQGSFYLTVWFYTDRIGSPDGNAYMLQVSPRNVQLARATRTGNNMPLGTTELPEGIRSVRLAIRTDVPNKTIAVYANDVLLRQWLDISSLDGLGRGLGFHLGGMAQQVRLSNLRVTTWDGQIDRLPEVLPAAGQEVIRLLNKDRIAGRVKGLREGVLLVQADFGELPLPLERVAGIDFAAPVVSNLPPAQAEASLVRAFLHGGGRLTMRVEGWAERQLTASGPYFDRTTFQSAMFQSLQFNLERNRVDMDFFDAPPRFPLSPEILLDGY